MNESSSNVLVVAREPCERAHDCKRGHFQLLARPALLRVNLNVVFDGLR
jgi:hypothetical protein